MARRTHDNTVAHRGLIPEAEIASGSPSAGDVPTYASPGVVEWAPPGAASLALDDLTDVNAPAPSDGDVLTFDDGTDTWIPAASAGGGQFDADAPALRHKATFDRIAAEAGDGATEDAFFAATVSSGNSTAAVEAYDATGQSEFAASGREADVTAEAIYLSVTDTDADSKHHLTGGHGLVVPLLAADPDPGDSEEGQIYYNTTSHTFRGCDDGGWGELVMIP